MLQRLSRYRTLLIVGHSSSGQPTLIAKSCHSPHLPQVALARATKSTFDRSGKVVVVVVDVVVVVSATIASVVVGAAVVSGEASSDLAELLPVTSGVSIATLAASATSITGLEYFSFKSFSLIGDKDSAQPH